MRILISKLPYSGWWSSGIPKYDDNPAMQEGAIPNLKILESERNNLISIIKNEGHELVELDFPNELDNINPKHDFVFIRDPFISNQKGDLVILKSGEPLRRIENEIIKESLEDMGYKTTSIPDKSDVRADGGEFYFCSKEDILFAGIQRNTKPGIESVSEALNVKKLLILDGSGYHLDTFFTPALDSNGKLAALIVCVAVLTNKTKKELYQFADLQNIPVYDVPVNDAIGTNDRLGTFAVNALPLPGLLIRPHKFTDPNLDKKLLEIGIKSIVTPTTQYQLSGGSIHCITNEL